MWRALERNATIAFQGLKPAIGFAASLLAVWCQILLLATISLAPLERMADPVGDFQICHTDNGSQPAHQPSHPAHSCVLCVCCISHAVSLAILSPMQTLPSGRTVASVHLCAVQARAPPVLLVAAAQPRGPPSLI